LADAGGLHGPAADALTEIGIRHRRLTVETINGLPAGDHPLGAILLESGFAISLKGLAYRGQARRQPARR
ncbi:MAG: hypothetical protein OXH89_04715, partial [bacterium]|nr:hypothetical protein [bacterium]